MLIVKNRNSFPEHHWRCEGEDITINEKTRPCSSGNTAAHCEGVRRTQHVSDGGHDRLSWLLPWLQEAPSQSINLPPSDVSRTKSSADGTKTWQSSGNHGSQTTLTHWQLLVMLVCTAMSCSLVPPSGIDTVTQNCTFCTVYVSGLNGTYSSPPSHNPVQFSARCCLLRSSTTLHLVGNIPMVKVLTTFIISWYNLHLLFSFNSSLYHLMMWFHSTNLLNCIFP